MSTAVDLQTVSNLLADDIARDGIGYEWTRAELNEYLTCESWIIKYPKSYDNTLKFIFKDNSIMLHKWVRYAEGVRSL